MCACIDPNARGLQVQSAGCRSSELLEQMQRRGVVAVAVLVGKVAEVPLVVRDVEWIGDVRHVRRLARRVARVVMVLVVVVMVVVVVVVVRGGGLGRMARETERVCGGRVAGGAWMSFFSSRCQLIFAKKVWRFTCHIGHGAQAGRAAGSAACSADRLRHRTRRNAHGC